MPLGAARCLLDADRGPSNVEHVINHVGGDDFVLVMETRRVGGLTDVADLEATNALLLLARSGHEPFEIVIDNTHRYITDSDDRRSR